MYPSLKSILFGLFINILDAPICVSILEYLRNHLDIIPMSVRLYCMRNSVVVPLWLCRIIVNIVTSPIGDERKWIHNIKQSTWRGVWIVPNLISLKQAEDTALHNDLIVLYIHGGGLCMGRSTMYMETFQLIINHLRNEHCIRASILSLEYSLTPENVWPKQCDEAIDAYRYLVDTIGVPSSKIILAGDSAGANIASTVLLRLNSQLNSDKETQILLPAGAAFLSPYMDATINHPSYDINDDSHDVLSAKIIAKYVPCYIPNYYNLDEESRLAMIRNPLISPFYGDFSGTCPIFVAYGENELLRTCIEDFIFNLERDECILTTLQGENAPHIWLVYKLYAASPQIYERDCKVLIDWMASTCKINGK